MKTSRLQSLRLWLGHVGGNAVYTAEKYNTCVLTSCWYVTQTCIWNKDIEKETRQITLKLKMIKGYTENLYRYEERKMKNER